MALRLACVLALVVVAARAAARAGGCDSLSENVHCAGMHLTALPRLLRNTVKLYVAARRTAPASDLARPRPHRLRWPTLSVPAQCHAAEVFLPAPPVCPARLDLPGAARNVHAVICRSTTSAAWGAALPAVAVTGPRPATKPPLKGAYSQKLYAVRNANEIFSISAKRADGPMNATRSGTAGGNTRAAEPCASNWGGERGVHGPGSPPCMQHRPAA